MFRSFIEEDQWYFGCPATTFKPRGFGLGNDLHCALYHWPVRFFNNRLSLLTICDSVLATPLLRAGFYVFYNALRLEMSRAVRAGVGVVVVFRNKFCDPR